MNEATFMPLLTSACRIPQVTRVFPDPLAGAAIMKRGRLICPSPPRCTRGSVRS